MNIEELKVREAELRGKISELYTEHESGDLSDEARSQWDDMNQELDQVQADLEEKIAMRARVEELAKKPESRDAGATFNTPRPGSVRGNDIYDMSTLPNPLQSPERASQELRDRAMRSIEDAHFPHERANQEDAQTRAAKLAESHDEVSKRILHTGSPVYKRGFGKMLAGRQLSADESRALATFTGSAGGYAVPYEIDPTIIPTSDSVINPLRAIGNVKTTVSNDWRAVTSGAVAASYVGEGAALTAVTPTLAQPTLHPEKAAVPIAFSMEVGEDWPALQSEMARLIQDAKDTLEANKFLNGAGHGSLEPEGLLTGATTTIDTTSSHTFASGDVYRLFEALKPRWRSRAQWVANLAFYDKVRQFDANGGSALWLRIGDNGSGSAPNQGNIGAEILGRAANEATEYGSTFTDGDTIATIGDFSMFQIIDRIGLSIEIDPHRRDGNGKLTGERELLAYWRNTSKVLSAAAFVSLKIKA